MLVYDITDTSSFQNIENWYEKVKINCPPNVVIMLVGNKADLESDRQVSQEEGQNYAATNKMLFIETSAKLRQNVEEAFVQLAKSIMPTLSKVKQEKELGKYLCFI